jgi:hypothetical protein
MYRQAPQDRRYVPGYWTNTPEGWRWVSGFWAPEAAEEIPYAPEPPATLENGPSFEGPEDSIYHPGYWNWRESRYVWRPGYWGQARLGRIWIQPCYRWTPAGYVFVNGYWDYPLEDRGLLFAPVVFDRAYWHDPSWYYQPDYCVRPFSLLDALFHWPLSSHYYFGDYYGHGMPGWGSTPGLAARIVTIRSSATTAGIIAMTMAGMTA